MAVSSEDITRYIVECAREERFDRSELMEEVCKRANFKFPGKVSTMITALISVGTLDNSSGVVKVSSGVPFMPSSDGNYETYKKRIAELEAEQAKANKKVQEAIQAAEAGIKAANEKVAAATKELESAKSNTRIIEVQVKSGPKKVKSITGVFHAKFERILSLAKRRKNIFIYGPTGCGKSYICSQVAKALNLNFYYVSCTSGMSEGTIAGRLLPVGKQGTFEYVIGEFVKAYEQGGVFLLDELDAADPNVVLIFNSALASETMSVPNRPDKPYAKRHPDFICIAAANTVGTGADRLYSGRNKLDAATLDRFQIGKVFMDYDPNIEEQLCPDAELRNHLLNYRTKIRQHRMERSMSSRFMQDAYEMKTEENWSLEEIEAAFFEGWREDERNKVKSSYGK